MFMKVFILTIYLHYPPDPDLVLDYRFTTQSACEAKGREVESSWHHLTIRETPGFIDWDCSNTEWIIVQ
jgi:hypothetical protein